ncbi:MAG: penicillin-binding protein 2 [Candidatus Moranbacteria bacterium]|nr:penicillin-binding protein 2 [Candidatus Moranbacteria bacterium]
MTRNRNYRPRNISGMEIEDYVLSATEKEAARMEKPLEKRWFDFLWWSMLAFVFLLGGRVIFLTVIKGAYYQNVSSGNSIRSIVIKAPRGRIFDRTGKPLVNNVPSMDVVIIPADVPRDDAKIKDVAAKVSSILNMDNNEVLADLQSNSKSKSLNPVLLKENIGQEQALIIMEKANDIPGISIEKTAIRDYVDGPIFSHILGYDGKIEQKELEQNQGYLLTDYIGKQGIEKSYEKYLRGVHGADQVEVDSMGNIKREVGIINSKPGSDLVMSIDADLQKKLYDSMTAILQKTNTKIASAVAINPQNGQVLAMVDVPSYDNNLFANKISGNDYANLINDPNKPLFNRSIAGEYPPGSTIKPAIAAAALSEGVITPSTTIDGLGGMLRIGSYTFGDWKTHGPSDVRTAIAQSNDIFFYTIGGGYGNIQGLGMNNMKKWDNLFGFGSPTGIDIGGEASGLIPDEQWKLDNIHEKWSVGNSYHAAIGQGYVTATPLQLANYTAAIANGGTLYKPQLVSKIKKSDGSVISIAPEVIRSGFVSPDVLNVVREGMRQTVLAGTAQPLKDMPIEIAGKTGTAQFGIGASQEHGWFISFAPFSNPEIAMAVLVEGAGEGFTSALPVTKEVYQWYFGGRN